MDVDVIILSNTTTNELFDILKQTVDSIHDSELEHKFNVIVVESCKEISSLFTHKLSEIRAKFVIPQVPKFNYNLYLNIGLRECKNDLVLITNNDVIYYKGWFTSIAKQFEIDPELMSVSPVDRKWHRHTESIFSSLKELYIGNRTSYEFTGWSFIVRRKLFDLLGGFDERFAFYYQDNDWVEMYNMACVQARIFIICLVSLMELLRQKIVICVVWIFSMLSSKRNGILDLFQSLTRDSACLFVQ